MHDNVECLGQSSSQVLVHCALNTSAALLQARSKPLEPPAKPASAPFFLPTVAGLHSEPLFDPSAADQDDQQAAEQSKSRVKRNAGTVHFLICMAPSVKHLHGAVVSSHLLQHNLDDLWLDSTLHAPAVSRSVAM